MPGQMSFQKPFDNLVSLFVSCYWFYHHKQSDSSNKNRQNIVLKPKWFFLQAFYDCEPAWNKKKRCWSSWFDKTWYKSMIRSNQFTRYHFLPWPLILKGDFSIFFNFSGPDIVGRTEGINSRVRQSLHNYRAIKLGLFKNGDPWFGPINYHFLPGRDVTSLESLFKILSPKMDLMNGKKIYYRILNIG